MGIVTGVYVGIDNIVSQAQERISLTFEGVEGDRHFGYTKKAGVREREYEKGTEIFNYRQISIVSPSDLKIIAQKMGVKEILPEWLGANLCINGIPDLTNLPPMTKLYFKDATIIVYGVNMPCKFPGEVIKDHYNLRVNEFKKMAEGHRGVIGWVEKEGIIRPGDLVSLKEFQIYKVHY